jgi:hypothetical protein
MLTDLPYLILVFIFIFFLILAALFLFRNFTVAALLLLSFPSLLDFLNLLLLLL